MKPQEIFCDFENGFIYRRLKKFNTYKRVGSNSTGYLLFQLKGKTVYNHRYLYEQYHNIKLKPDEHINHINHNTQDNRISNLEVVNNQENIQYQQIRKDNTE